MKNNSKNTFLWATCAAGRKIYKYQFNKTSEVKTQSLQSVLNDKFPDYLSFGSDLKSMASYLCDSKRFSQECDDLKLQPNIVAQHVVFEGAKTFEKVRNYGVKAVFGSQAHEFNKPLIAE